MPKKTGTIHIKWVRSGIAFTRKQKEMVRSIGLKRLNQVIERPDTVQFRGLVAKVSHLVEVVSPAEAPAWAEVPEYKIIPAVEATGKAAPVAKKTKSAKQQPAEPTTEAKEVATKEKDTAVAPAGKSAAAKGRTAKSSEAKAAAGSEKPAPKRRPSAAKSAASDKKESKPKKGKK